MTFADNKIYLASKSPRRRELLRQVGVEFELLLLREESALEDGIDETPYDGEAPLAYVERVAREKAEAGWNASRWRKLPLRPVLAADTTVTIDGRILGKPQDADEAFAMLSSLSGRAHQVLTSVAVMAHDQLTQETNVSDVVFGDLSESLLRHYCALGEPYDKAGAYAVQGFAAQFVKRISGSYSGIMGLPLYETIRLLRQAGIKTP